MYLAVNIEIEFPASRGRQALLLRSCSSFKVESSWMELTDRAEVVLAKRIYLEDKKLFEFLKSGDTIIIRGGYNGEYHEEFRGYITEVHDDLPVMIKSEDNMYVLKRTKCHISLKETTLANFLKQIVPSQFKIDAADINIGSVLFRDFTVSQALMELKDKLGIYSYFVGNTLISGKYYEDNTDPEKVKYEFGKNIIENDLKYRRKDDVKIKVKAIGSQTNGVKIIEEVGDDSGQVVQLNFTRVSDKSDLKKRAQKELDRLKIDGYQGGLVGYGIPIVKHGYVAEIINHDNADSNGNYYVEAVITILSDNGKYRRHVKIGKKAA